MLNWYNTKVTLELNDLIESGCKPWDFEYPSYYQGDEKAAFEQKVIDHYRFRQIGQETPGRWLHYFRTRIREIMPYYIQLYKSQELMQSLDDPFGNVNVTETFEQTSTGERSGSLNRNTSGSLESSTTGSLDRSTSGSLDSTTTGSSEGTTTGTENNTGSSAKKFSNTPQGSLDNLDNYLTEATVESAENEKTTNGSSEETTQGTQKDTTTGTQTDTTQGTQTDTTTGTQSDTTQDSESGTVRHTLTRKGNQGVNTYAHDMKELRETFLNIDMMIINELKDLFLMVY